MCKIKPRKFHVTTVYNPLIWYYISKIRNLKWCYLKLRVSLTNIELRAIFIELSKQTTNKHTSSYYWLLLIHYIRVCVCVLNQFNMNIKAECMKSQTRIFYKSSTSIVKWHALSFSYIYASGHIANSLLRKILSTYAFKIWINWDVMNNIVYK